MSFSYDVRSDHKCHFLMISSSKKAKSDNIPVDLKVDGVQFKRVTHAQDFLLNQRHKTSKIKTVVLLFAQQHLEVTLNFFTFFLFYLALTKIGKHTSYNALFLEQF